MEQYGPHYHGCQLLKEFVFFTWDPKKPEKSVFCIKLKFKPGQLTYWKTSAYVFSERGPEIQPNITLQ